MSDFHNLPSLRAALKALSDVINNPPPQPEFTCPHCGNVERSGHPCPSRTGIDAQRRVIGGLDGWLNQR